MALENILCSLFTIKDGKRTPSDKYNAGLVLGANQGLDELEKANLYTKEGIDKYKKITGDDPKKYSADELDLRKRIHTEQGKNDFSRYVEKHYGDLAKEIDEEDQVKLAYVHCPEKDLTDNKPYNGTRKVVADSKETIKKISEKPKEFVNEKIRNEENQYVASCLALYAKEYIQLKQLEAQRKGMTAISKYGAHKFLKETKDQTRSLREEFEGKKSKLEEEIYKAIIEKEKQGTLSSQERADVASAKYEEIMKLAEKYGPAVELDKKLTQETFAYAFAKIKEKKPEIPNIPTPNYSKVLTPKPAAQSAPATQ